MREIQPIRTIEDLVNEVSEQVKRGGASDRDQIRNALSVVERFVVDCEDFPVDRFDPGESSYSRHLLYADPEDRFSLMCLVWRPGQGTPIHDHPSWGVLGVLHGRMRFVNYAHDEISGHRCLVPVETFVAAKGSVGTVYPPMVDIHRMENASREELAVTIHCYGCEIKEFYIYNAETAQRRIASAQYDSVLDLALHR